MFYGQRGRSRQSTVCIAYKWLYMRLRPRHVEIHLRFLGFAFFLDWDKGKKEKRKGRLTFTIIRVFLKNVFLVTLFVGRVMFLSRKHWANRILSSALIDFKREKMYTTWFRGCLSKWQFDIGTRKNSYTNIFPPVLKSLISFLVFSPLQFQWRPASTQGPHLSFAVWWTVSQWSDSRKKKRIIRLNP